jgi:hypothetical protein
MSAPLLATKLYLPPPPLKAVPRPRLIARLNEALIGMGAVLFVATWLLLPPTDGAGIGVHLLFLFTEIATAKA